jgi:hypothetical protein
VSDKYQDELCEQNRSDVTIDCKPSESAALGSAKKRGNRSAKRRGSHNKITFTEAWCASLTPQAKPVPFWDAACRGFALRLYPTGKRVFYAVERTPWGKNPIWKYLGCWPEMTVKEARSAAHTAVEEITHREPPNAKGALMNDLIETYIARHLRAKDAKTGKPKLRSGEFREKGLHRVVIPAWVGLASTDVTRTEIVKLIIAQKEVRANPNYPGHGQKRTLGGPFAAVELYGVLHAMFAWLCDPLAEVSLEPLLPSNPMPNKPERIHGVPAKDRKRKTLLRTSDELRAYWSAALKLPTPASEFFRAGLLSGQRRSQIACLRRDMIREVGVPPIRCLLFGEPDMKMEEMHLLPVTGGMERLLDALPVFEGSPWLFTYSGERPFQSVVRYKEKMEEMMKNGSWVFHDMRRTIRSHMSSLEFPNGQKIQDEVLEMILSHKPQGIVGIYMLYRRLKEMRDALELWEEYLMKIVLDELDVELAV